MPDRPTLQFLGGAGTVTGSKHLLTVGGERMLLDCGLFQGAKVLRQRNWASPAVNGADVEAVVLSHAHLDHSGALPLLVRHGFSGPIYCTPATAALARVLLLDAAHLQEEEAERANRYGYSKHKLALPLYTTADAEAALQLLEPRPYHERFEVIPGAAAMFRRAGHILGSATVEVAVGNGRPTRLVFSGDLGRWGRPILRDPEIVSEAEVLLIESTYGDRTHGPSASTALADVVCDVAKHGGGLIVPAFAVGRTQELIWTLRQLEEQGSVPSLPVFIDSPMAIDVTDVYCRYPEEHNLDMKLLMDEKRCPLCCKQYNIARTPQESRSLNDRHGPMIIISASGMATGGRVLHHLKLRLPDERTTVLLPGFQAAGTRGRALQEGAHEIRIHGESVRVRAKIVTIDGLSAHADREELLRWASGFSRPPQMTYVVHGEPQASRSLAEALETRMGWPVRVAEDRQKVEMPR